MRNRPLIVIDTVQMVWRTKPAWHAIVCAAVVLVSGCASSSGPTVEALDGPLPTKHTNKTSGHTLTDEERALDCKVIRGRMKVAIFQLQSERKTPTSTALSRTMQNAAASIFGGTTYGTNPTARATRETARLQAYNGLLKDQNCKTYDLQKELASSTSG